MGIESGFFQGGFTDDREEKAKWAKFEERVTGGGSSKFSGEEEEKPEVDGKLNIDDVKEWQSDVQSSVSNTTTTKKSTFLQRNKRQIIDAVIVLGVIYVAYKLFWEKDGDDFAEGGDIEMEPAPAPPRQAPAPEMAPPPPRAEMPEPTYNPEG